MEIFFKMTSFCFLLLFLEPCTLTLNQDGTVWVTSAKPIRALTPGQVCIEMTVACLEDSYDSMNLEAKSTSNPLGLFPSLGF